MLADCDAIKISSKAKLPAPSIDASSLALPRRCSNIDVLTQANNKVEELEARIAMYERENNILRAKAESLEKELENIRANEIVSEIRVLVPGQHLFAENSDPDAMKAFSRAYSSIKRRVKQHNNKLHEHQSPIRLLNQMANN